MLQLRSKKLFTSIYCLQVLTKPCWIPLIREHLSLSGSWFSYARTQKNTFFWKHWFRKKTQKKFIVYNNDKIIRAWSRSSKWLVCRSTVNQTTGGTSRTRLSTFFNTNIFKYCALFCNKVAKIYLQQRNSFDSDNGQMHFCTFSELFPF